VLVVQGKLQEALDAYQRVVELFRDVVSYQPINQTIYHVTGCRLRSAILLSTWS